jgi:CRISPR-associated protein Csx10
MALDQQLNVTIRLESPLLITRKQVGFVWESEPFIPGGVLRGAVAGVAAREGEDLKALFGRPNAPRFASAHVGLKHPVGVLPQTARTCKRHGGFRRDGQDEERHGVLDTLLSQAFGEIQMEARCPVCEEKTTVYSEFPYVAISSAGQWRYVSPSPIFRRIGHTGVARERGAAADRLLYTLEVISRQMERDELNNYGLPKEAATAFHSTVWIDSADQAPWADWLTAVSHLGGARSRGLGKVKIKVEKASSVEPTGRELFQTTIQLTEGNLANVSVDDHPENMSSLDRILAFNRKAYEYLSSNEDERGQHWYFTLDLQSETILTDVRGPCYSLNAAELGLPPAVERIWWLAEYGRARGWSNAWGLPKPILPTLSAGTAFLYRVPRGDEALTKSVLERCIILEREGIGQRRAEGLGWVQVCTPFHLETEV